MNNTNKISITLAIIIAPFILIFWQLIKNDPDIKKACERR